jgi:hypothetical protein
VRITPIIVIIPPMIAEAMIASFNAKKAMKTPKMGTRYMKTTVFEAPIL